MSQFDDHKLWTNSDLMAQETLYNKILTNPASFPTANITRIANLWDAIHDEMMARGISPAPRIECPTKKAKN